MAIIGHGIDIVDIERFAVLAEREGYRNRCFTPGELSQCQGKADRLAARFAAKEAVLKALGTGLSHGISLKQVEIAFDRVGAPKVALTGAAAEAANDRGIERWHLTFSHSLGNAIASAIAES